MGKRIRHRKRYAVKVYVPPFFWYTDSRFNDRDRAITHARILEKTFDTKAWVVDTFSRAERKNADRP